VGPFSVPTNAGIDGLDAVLRTISERVAMVVEELQQTQQDALRSEQLAAVGQLAAGLAHELRNPLMAMKLLVQSACEQGNEASLCGPDLAVIEEEIGRLEHLVQMFLDFARPPRLEKHEVDLRNAIGQVVHLLEPRAAGRVVQLRFKPPRKPVVVEADETQIRQVLLNLILNAMDAVAAGGRIDVQVVLQHERDVGRWAVIRVADDGCGLPAELGDRIFDPFVSTKETGIGLGLSICRRIVETHRGEITAAPAPAGGTVFTVRLPADARSAERPTTPPGERAARGDSREVPSVKGKGCQRSWLSTTRPTSATR
jgi:signal transduction histidine kinase